MNAYLLAVALLGVLSLPAFAAGPEGLGCASIPRAGGGTAEGTVLKWKDNGRVVEARVGDVIKVQLEIQGGTGYGWYPEGLDETRLRFLGEETAVRGGDKKKLGGPVAGIWSFKAAGPGDAFLKMLYYRVWEGKKSAVKEFGVKVHVVERQ